VKSGRSCPFSTLFSKNEKPKWALISNRTYYEH
jgi:hypothetical protein